MQVSTVKIKPLHWKTELTNCAITGNAGKVETIRVNNYLSVRDWLQFPDTQIDFYDEEISPGGPFTTYDILPSSLVYSCGTTTRLPCEIQSNGRGMIAGTSSQMTNQVLAPFGATVVFLCPKFFDRMRRDWTSTPQAWAIDGSSTLLHEAQHMIQITGPSHLAIDVPTIGEGDCYKIEV